MKRQIRAWTAGLVLTCTFSLTTHMAAVLPAQDYGNPQGEMPVAGCAECAAPTCEVGCYDAPYSCGFDCPPMLTDHTYFDPPATCEVVDPRIYRSIFLGHLWVEAEYLAWASSDNHLPPLLVSNPDGPIDTAPGLLFGDIRVHDGLRSGGRLTGGYWFTPDHCVGIEASFFGVDGNNVEYDSSKTNVDTVSRYVIDSGNQGEYAVGVVSPNTFTGYSRVEADVLLSGAEVLWRQMVRNAAGHRMDYVAGYRYVRLNDSLHVVDHMVPYDAETGEASEYVTIDRSDRLETESEFHGAEFGLIGRWWRRRWALQTLGKVALGGTRSSATIDGSIQRVDTSVVYDPPRESPSAPVGVLTGPSNNGRYGQSDVSVVGEAGIRLEYAMTRQCRVTFGYTLLYLSNVTRVLDSVDVVVEPDQIPDPNDPDAIDDFVDNGSERPDFVLRNRDFWTQGLSVGIHYDF